MQALSQFNCVLSNPQLDLGNGQENVSHNKTSYLVINVNSSLLVKEAYRAPFTNMDSLWSQQVVWFIWKCGKKVFIQSQH